MSIHSTAATASPPSTPRPWHRRLFGAAPARIVAGLIALALTAALVSNVIRAVTPEHLRKGWPSLVTAAAVLLVYIGWVRLTERRAATAAELSRGGALPEAFAGLAGGFVLVAILVGVAALAGVYRVGAVAAWTPMLLVPLAQMAFVGVIEETMFRGLLFRVTESALGTWPAVAISSILFGVAHLATGMTLFVLVNATLAGVLFAALYMLTRRLWLPIGVHVGWNYALGTLFAVPVSGHDNGPVLLAGRLAGTDALTGGAYGLEGSVFALVVVGAASACLLRLASRRTGRNRANRANPG